MRRGVGRQESVAMELIIVFGPPAVGKMTVGREICGLTGYKLFHNHLTVEPIVEVFGFGSPQFGRLVSEFRRRVIEEAANAQLPGVVFTYVWSLADEDDARSVADYVRLVTSRGGKVRFVELFATQAARLVRNEHPVRLDHKPSKRDLEGSRAHLLDVDISHVLNTGGDRLPAHDLLDQHDYVRIDNTSLEPGEVALQVVEQLGLATI